MNVHLEERRPRSIDDAWLNLAADVLLLAIHDVRKSRDVRRSQKAKAWLLSPAGQLFFDAVLDPQFDVHKWVEANCPNLKMTGSRNWKNNIPAATSRKT